VRWARSVGLRAGQHRLAHGPPTGLLALEEKLADKLFFSKLKAGLGLDQLRVAATGAAPIGMDVLEFFLSCGIPIYEVYSQSEGSGAATTNRIAPGETRLGTVGRAMPGVEVKTAEDGENIVRGPNVFLGYYKDPEATAATLRDGWLLSGDVGEFDRDGFLKITDRKKELLVTSGGKNVAPQNIEKLLRAIDGVAQAVVIGDRRNYLTALIALDAQWVETQAAARGFPTDRAALATHAGLLAHIQAGIDRANRELARYENVRKFVVVPNDFSIEGGELTPTQKLRRKIIVEKYATYIDGLYAGASDAGAQQSGAAAG
jgi:long-chain acyl-CoA synthetase